MDIEKIALALQGAGAGLQGQGAQWQAAQASMAQAKADREAQAKKDRQAKRTNRQKRLREEQDFVMSSLEGIQDPLVMRERLQSMQGAVSKPTFDNLVAPMLAMDDAALAGRVGSSAVPADQQAFEALIADFSEEDQESARRIKAGLEPRAMTSADMELAQNPQLMELVMKLAEERGERGSRGKGIGAGKADRLNAAIEAGAAASQSLPLLRRTRELLNEVETGGWDSAALKLKSWTGRESANEAELTANLARAVLGQLKQTFGSQFTEKEGERLERIEASVGKSTQGNIRLVSQLYKMADAKSRMGMKAARKAGDVDALQQMRQWRKATFDDSDAIDMFAPTGRIKVLGVE